MIAEALCKIPILALAFNKRISDEMKLRLPFNTKSSTINAIGHAAWGAHINRRKLDVNPKKSFDIIKGLTQALPRYRRGEAGEEFSAALATVRLAKAQGYIPPRSALAARTLISSDDFFGGLDEEPSGLLVDLTNDALLESIRLGFEGKIDFDDQIYLSTLLADRGFPQFPLVLVDETQDLSPLNHRMLRRLVSRRIIAVGDDLQSIYAFRGAMSSSMRALAEAFNMRELGLSISFRCPQAVVTAARFRAPHMQWAPSALAGTVRSLSTWSSAEIPDGAAILCRNNAPLYSCALRLIAAGRGVKLVGSDIGPQLTKALRKLGHETLTQEETLSAIDKWETEKLAKTRSEGATRDRADCLRVFAGYGQSLGESIAWAERLFAEGGQVQLLSIHKAKGLEWDTVYFLDPWRIPSRYAITDEEKEQELNARYVATTRAKRELFYVNLSDLDKETEDDEIT